MKSIIVQESATYDSGRAIRCQGGNLRGSTFETVFTEECREVSAQSRACDLLAHVDEHSYVLVSVQHVG